ncbi:conserved membrane hypothetical protein [[Clostridium] ultunense Esp]|uniref:DUF1294 domain-containing protein n=1 Tax=Thermicanus aegyptius TaxID=94009 RepID=UPI0002B7023E|nr:DUF1294 domain-containing protein [Thermicanus aegyptius]CCQ96498.1 conserved membrane hypothetical protein [[Clostridium] ultunense Esp]
MISPIEAVIASILIFINLLGLILMGFDKRKAERGGRRVPEKTFFLLSALGGAFGVWLGMRFFRHKTKHFRFLLWIPVFFFLQILLFYFYYDHRFM